MKQHTKRTQRDYTVSFKQSVVDQVERGEMSYKAAQHRYGIQGNTTVLRWLRRYGRQNWMAGTPSPFLQDLPMPLSRLTPEQRIKELESLLSQARQREQEAEQKAEFFKAVVDVLEKDYGVSLTKKRSGRSSHKLVSAG
jgi:transposase-like protein